MPRIKQPKMITVFINATFKGAAQENAFRESLGSVLEAFVRVYKVTGTDVSLTISQPPVETKEEEEGDKDEE